MVKVVCTICGRVKIEEGKNINDYDGLNLSHGFCARCNAIFNCLKEIDLYEEGEVVEEIRGWVDDKEKWEGEDLLGDLDKLLESGFSKDFFANEEKLKNDKDFDWKSEAKENIERLIKNAEKIKEEIIAEREERKIGNKK